MIEFLLVRHGAHYILISLKDAMFAHGWVPEWPKGTDCKSAANCFGGSNPRGSIDNVRGLPLFIDQLASWLRTLHSRFARTEPCRQDSSHGASAAGPSSRRIAGVAELADARDLKSLGGNTVPVQVRLPALIVFFEKPENMRFLGFLLLNSIMFSGRPKVESGSCRR